VNPKRRGLVVQAIAYGCALTGASVVVLSIRVEPTWLELLLADLIATVIVFGFSVALRNSSLYDPYWSVAPPVLGGAFLALEPTGVRWRVVLALGLTVLWGVRLTYSFFRGWPGLHHEDWRYRDLRDKTGRAYRLVSFLGIHLFPTLLTFAGSVALFGALSGEAPLSLLDGLATLVTAVAILIEATADRQLSDHLRSAPAPGAILATGLWAYSRHPNYLGEILFWWGLALFALAADAPLVVSLGGASAITLLFLFVSIPMIERRMRARRPDWPAYAERVAVLVPILPRHFRAR
jgi:steroid 5-alpha reductase family enzyme